MDLDSLTVKEAKALQSLLKGGSESAPSPYQIGQPYFFRLVTHYLTGRVKRVTPKEIVLSEAAWIADTGRFSEALATGKLNEVEPFPQDEEVIIGRGALIDAIRWKHALPTSTK